MCQQTIAATELALDDSSVVDYTFRRASMYKYRRAELSNGVLIGRRGAHGNALGCMEALAKREIPMITVMKSIVLGVMMFSFLIGWSVAEPDPTPATNYDCNSCVQIEKLEKVYEDAEKRCEADKLLDRTTNSCDIASDALEALDAAARACAGVTSSAEKQKIELQASPATCSGCRVPCGAYCCPRYCGACCPSGSRGCGEDCAYCCS